MAQHYHCDACWKQIDVSEKWYIYYLFPLGEHVSKYEFCNDCMKKVTKFMKSLKKEKK